MTTGLSPLDLASGYAVPANGGYRVEPRTIIQIYDRQNRPLVEEQFCQPVFEKETCRDMTGLLRAVVMYGTGKGAGLSVPVAGKTGTTEQIKGTGNRDAWFAGYTPEVAAAVWMGYDRPDAGYALGFSGGSYPARLFREFVAGALKELPARESDCFRAGRFTPHLRQSRSHPLRKRKSRWSRPVKRQWEQKRADI